MAMNECPLCGAIVTGDECSCGEEEEELWFLLFHRPDQEHLSAGTYHFVGSSRAELIQFFEKRFGERWVAAATPRKSCGWHLYKGTAGSWFNAFLEDEHMSVRRFWDPRSLSSLQDVAPPDADYKQLNFVESRQWQ